MRLLFSFVLLLWSVVANSAVTTYGPEWEFGHPTMRHFPFSDLDHIHNNFGIVPTEKHEKPWVEKMASEFRKRCGDECVEFAYRARSDDTFDSYRYTFKDGYWIEITPDTWVVEIKAKPQTLKELKINRNRIQHLVFESAEAVGLKAGGSAIPIGFPSKSHFNVGTSSSFNDDGRAYLQFLSDYSNTPELASGVLGRDRMDAPPLSHLKAESRSQFQALVDDANRGTKLLPREVASRIQNQVYTEAAVPFFGEEHSQAVGLKRAVSTSVDHDLPTEFRAIRAQKNIDEFIALAELMESRIAFAKTRSKTGAQIIFRNTNQLKFSKQAQVDAFYTYVTEAGLDYEKFKILMADHLVKIKPSGVLTDQLNWKNAGYVSGIEMQLDRIATSDWLRDKVLKSLQRPDALKSGKGEILIKKIFAKVGEAKTPTASRRALLSLLADVEKSPVWINSKSSVFTIQKAKLGDSPEMRPVVESNGRECYSGFVRMVRVLTGWQKKL